jgi:hypothetical protein
MKTLLLAACLAALVFVPVISSELYKTPLSQKHSEDISRADFFGLPPDSFHIEMPLNNNPLIFAQADIAFIRLGSYPSYAIPRDTGEQR